MKVWKKAGHKLLPSILLILFSLGLLERVTVILYLFHVCTSQLIGIILNKITRIASNDH